MRPTHKAESDFLRFHTQKVKKNVLFFFFFGGGRGGGGPFKKRMVQNDVQISGKSPFSGNKLVQVVGF